MSDENQNYEILRLKICESQIFKTF
jgi:hypothetical protein